MSMPHECTCRICGGLMAPQIYTSSGLTEEQARAQRAVDARSLASAIVKIAPEQAKQIAARWEDLVKDEHAALEEFLTFLRSCS